MPRKRQLPRGLWERNGVYYARFRAGGRLIRKRLSTNFDAACQLLNELRARADRADFGLMDNDYPFATLKGEFLRWAEQSVRRPGEYRADLQRFEAYAPIRSIAQIDQQYVIGYRKWRLGQTRNQRVGADHVSPRTVNREVTTLNNMLNHGVTWGRIGFNPIAGLKPLAHDQRSKERRSLSLQEVESLFANSPDYLKPVWRMFMCTGIRRSELVELRFADVDFDRRVVVISAARAKNRRAREIPLDDTIVAELQTLRDQAKARTPAKGTTVTQTASQAAAFSREHVFVTQANTPLRNNLLKRFYAICKKAGIDGAEPGGSIDIHSLRVSFATLSLEHGANPKAVQAILGHSTLALTMSVYARATERSKREAIGALPFAKTSAPDHIVAVQNAHALRTGEKSKAKHAAAQ